MKNKERAERIILALEDLLTGCDDIYDANGCERCPLRNLACVKEDDIVDTGDVSRGVFMSFLDFADDVRGYMSEEDYAAELADLSRQEIDDDY